MTLQILGTPGLQAAFSLSHETLPNERTANGSDKCAALQLCVLISTGHPIVNLLEEAVHLAGAGSRPRSVELNHPQQHRYIA